MRYTCAQIRPVDPVFNTGARDEEQQLRVVDSFASDRCAIVAHLRRA